MPRTYIKKNIRCKFDPENMKKAILEVKKGVPIRTAAAKFDVPSSTLGKHYKDPGKKIGAGRKQEISEEDEAALAKYLEVCSVHGEGLTRQEMLELVKEFLDNCKIKTRWIDNKPGDDWFGTFFKRHSHLRIRKGENLSNQRVRGADPFTVHNFYNDVKKIYKKEKITEDNAGLIYNCDETSFSHDPDEVRVIAKKGTKRVSKNVAGSGKTNTTVLACGAADGTKMPPFIVFSGTYVWNTWIPKDDYPGTAYTAQKKGWMEGSIFANWFTQVFLNNIPSKEDRNGKKVVLFFYGVAFHINYAIVKMAYDNNVILVKLPPNLTHYMQPLDKTVFKPLKGAWNTLMIQWNRRHPGVPLAKEEFSRYIKTLWEENFHPRLLRSGFLNTGLFPVDETKFPEEAFDPIKLHRFRAEQTAKSRKNMTGSPSIVSTPTSTRSMLTTPLNTPVTTLASSTPETIGIPTSVDQTTPASQGETVANADATNIETEVLAYPLPDANQPQCSSWPDGTRSPSTFENFIRFKLTENVMKSRPKTTGKRKKISEQKGEILTSKIVMERIRKSEEEKKGKGARKMKQEKGKNCLKKQKQKLAVLIVSN